MVSKISKFFLLAALCLLVRLIPFRVPNVEPILASVMPLASVYGALTGFFFAVLSILSYDALTGTLGIHTFFTAGAYGLLGLWAGSYFSAKGGSASGRKNRIRDYATFAIIGTLFFDATTGLIGPIFYQQPFAAAFYGQIPFTALHLLGNLAFAITLSPAVYHILIRKRKAAKQISIISALNPKTI